MKNTYDRLNAWLCKLLGAVTYQLIKLCWKISWRAPIVFLDLIGAVKLYCVHLCSPVSGRVTYKGKPLAGVTIQRSLDYDDKTYQDQIETDTDGRFYFYPVSIFSKYPNLWMCHQSLRRSITMEFDEKYYWLCRTFGEAFTNMEEEKIDEEEFLMLLDLHVELTECDFIPLEE
ncbi:DUF6795 domain-containing protein [Algicola sagamiensis]|uniref:DUF6795 domain-containing protein n=1 Tax=Algicola sagamiensis TaxID=163869 RepID=UPI00039E2231|nr:DUF6795 domain-containing protein [Algicola sagamiensis]